MPSSGQIFDLCALKEWSVQEVTKALGVSAAQVYLAKHRVASAIAKEIRRLEKEMEQLRRERDLVKNKIESLLESLSQFTEESVV